MVLIIKKITPKRIDIILIPKMPFDNMIERHVERKGLARGRLNTCFVTSAREWTGKPRHIKTTKLLLESLKGQRIVEGENKFPIPHHLSRNIKCRDFDSLGYSESPVFEGSFGINFVRIRGRGKAAIAKMQTYEKISLSERMKIMNTFRNIRELIEERKKKGEKEGKVFVFLARHIHPAKKRKVF